MQPLAAAASQEEPALPASSCLQIVNMLTAQDVASEEAYGDIKEDLAEDFSEHGKVLALEVRHRATGPQGRGRRPRGRRAATRKRAGLGPARERRERREGAGASLLCLRPLPPERAAKGALAA